MRKRTGISHSPLLAHTQPLLLTTHHSMVVLSLQSMNLGWHLIVPSYSFTWARFILGQYQWFSFLYVCLFVCLFYGHTHAPHGNSWARDWIQAAAAPALDPLTYCTSQGSNLHLLSHPSHHTQIFNPPHYGRNSNSDFLSTSWVFSVNVPKHLYTEINCFYYKLLLFFHIRIKKFIILILS